MNIKKILSFALGPIGSALMGFVALPFTAWFFSPQDIGRIAMMQTAGGLFVMICCFGLDQAYVREYHAVSSKIRLFKTVSFLPILIALFFLIMGLIFPEYYSQLLFNTKSKFIGFIITLFCFCMLLNRFLSLILRMQERGYSFSFSLILPKLIYIAAIGAYSLLNLSYDYKYLVIANFAAVLFVAIYLLIKTPKVWFSCIREKIDNAEHTKVFKFGFPLLFGSIAFWGLTAMDKIFLRSMSTFEELGIYSVSVSFAAAGIIIQSVFTTLWAPIVYKWAENGENLDKINNVINIMLFVVVIVFCLIGIFSPLVDYVLPSEYEKVKYMLVVCMAYPLFYTLSEATSVGIGITKKTSYSLLATLFACAVNLGGNYLLVPIYGAIGAAISTAMAFYSLLVVRTELAIYAWKPLKRNILYSISFIVLIISIFFLLIKNEYKFLAMYVWIFLFLLVIYFSKERLSITYIKKIFNKDI